MSSQRARASLLSVVMVFSFAGCFKWTSASDPTQGLRDGNPHQVRVTLDDGKVVELWDVEIVDDEIVGFTQRPPRPKSWQASLERANLPMAHFPLDRVERLEVWGPDAAVTALIAGTILAIFLLPALAL